MRKTTLAPAGAARLLRLAAVALALAAPLSVTAARGIDCAASRSPREQAVCADPDLVKLDGELSRRYDAALKQLSGEGQRTLREGQRAWLRYADDVCFRLASPAGDSKDCLRELYAKRLEDLGAAAVRVGPFLFTRVDHFYALADPEHEGPAHGETSYPRIDRPASSTTRAWNAVAAPTTEPVREGWCDGPGDVFVGFKVVSASAAAISLETSTSAYCHGAPHGHGGIVGLTYVLKPAVRLLAADDLFALGNDWQAFLAERCSAALDRKDPGALTDADRDAIRRAVTDPRVWTLGDAGLVITLPAGAVKGYAQGASVVTIPWSDLRPFLRPGAPVPGRR